jgi:hypothetical protein
MADTFSTLDTGEYVPMPKVPKGGELTMQDVLGVREPFMSKRKNLESELSKSELDEAEARQKEKIMETRGKADVSKLAAEQEKTVQEDYQKQLVAEPLPAFIPTKDSAKDIAGLFSMVSVMGMLLGGGGKLNAMQTLNAMNGMLEGHQKGRADLYKKQATEFDKNFKAMTKKHEELRKKMEDAVKLIASDKQAGMDAAVAAAAESGSDIIKAMVRRGEVVRALKTLNDTVEGREAALKLVLTEQDRAATRKAAADRDKATADYRVKEMAFQKEKFEFEKKKAEAKLTKGKGGLGAKSFLESSLGVSAPDEKTSQKIVDTALGISQLGHVINIFKDPEVKTGVVSKLSSVNQKLTSLGDNNHEISDDELKRIINGEISPSAKNAVAQKEALFAAYTAEREIAGGRLLVSVVKQAGGALDPTNYEKAGFLNLLGGRREELIKRLRGARMSDDQINKIVQDIQGDAKDSRNFGDVVSQTPKSSDKKAMPTGEKLKAYTAAHPEFQGSEDEAKNFLRSQGYE